MKTADAVTLFVVLLAGNCLIVSFWLTRILQVWRG